MRSLSLANFNKDREEARTKLLDDLAPSRFDDCLGVGLEQYNTTFVFDAQLEAFKDPYRNVGCPCLALCVDKAFATRSWRSAPTCSRSSPASSSTLP